MKIHEVKLNEISKNDKFRFTTSNIPAPLKKSISGLGVSNPVYLISKGKKFQILAGFKRFHCAAALKQKTIPAKIVTQEEIPELFCNLLLEHLSIRNLNIIEKSRILQILQQLKIPQKQVEKKYLRIIDIPLQRKVVDQILQLLELPEEVQNYIEKYDLSLKQTEVFNRFKAEVNRRFIRMAEQLNIRAVELEKIMTLFEDIAGKESVTVKSIVSDMEVDSILNNDTLSRNQKLTHITQKLEQRRYSQLKGWNQKLEHLSKKLRIPEFMNITWDPSLERTGLELHAQIRSGNDIESIVAFFLKKTVKNNLEKMLKII